MFPDGLLMDLKIFILVVITIKVASYKNIWTYECKEGFCEKKRLNVDVDEAGATSLSSCQVLCSKYLGLWPKPSGEMKFELSISKININRTIIEFSSAEAPITNLIDEAGKRFQHILLSKAEILGETPNRDGKNLTITLKITDVTITKSYNQSETYSLKISSKNEDNVLVEITAENYFGARNGLETLSQLIYFDDIRNEFQVPDTVSLEDGPAYMHRGVLLDTARNFISVTTIKRTIDGMAASKLNVFHWHLTDTQSFPYVIESLPELSTIGAYSSKKIYSKEDIEEIVEFARVRGVYVMPEFDAPAHVGEGWQDTDFLSCFNKKPWMSYCVEPPCGQLNPTKDGLYDFLEKIYGDIITKFDPDIFHMGGDEVSIKCWNSDPTITAWMKANNISINDDGFVKLWANFQDEALKRFKKQGDRNIPVVLWTSTLTDESNLKYLSKDTYVIQIWTKSIDSTIARLLENGIKVILSNYDALYLDCGFANWVGRMGNNWCSPYIGWQEIYENSPSKIAGNYKHLVLGSEAALWTEQADDASLDSRIWPRAAALAERLWSDPVSTYKDAEDRFVLQRNRLTTMKIGADAVVPEWCSKYQGSCSNDGVRNI